MYRARKADNSIRFYTFIFHPLGECWI